MTAVKICGITHVEHGLAALEGGADLLGFVFYPPSHRYVTPSAAREIIERCRRHFATGWQAVGVFVNEPLARLTEISEAARLDLVQLAGQEDPTYCKSAPRPAIKVIRMSVVGEPVGSADPADWNAARILLDADRPGHYGGTGQAFDWRGARPYASRAILAGGLSPQNVRQALSQAGPWGLDVSSGVERDRRKDPLLIQKFLKEVKGHVGSG
jgi:phosphoribosylanthranilate isomerase